MRKNLSKVKKALQIALLVSYALLALFYIVLLILGEDAVMGNPILRAMDDAAPDICIVCSLLIIVVSFSIRLWEKKHPPKEDEPLSKGGGQHSIRS